MDKDILMQRLILDNNLRDWSQDQSLYQSPDWSLRSISVTATTLIPVLISEIDREINIRDWHLYQSLYNFCIQMIILEINLKIDLCINLRDFRDWSNHCIDLRSWSLDTEIDKQINFRYQSPRLWPHDKSRYWFQMLIQRSHWSIS